MRKVAASWNDGEAMELLVQTLIVCLKYDGGASCYVGKTSDIGAIDK